MGSEMCIRDRYNSTRNQQTYIEERARTERMFNSRSPISDETTSKCFDYIELFIFDYQIIIQNIVFNKGLLIAPYLIMTNCIVSELFLEFLIHLNIHSQDNKLPLQTNKQTKATLIGSMLVACTLYGVFL